VKIINNTGTGLNYVVTQSGSPLSGSQIIASGFVSGNSASEFDVPNAGVNPIVYVKAFTYPQLGNKGYIGRQLANGKSTVAITFEEED
jgi:hypothetical protein